MKQENMNRKLKIHPWIIENQRRFEEYANQESRRDLLMLSFVITFVCLLIGLLIYTLRGWIIEYWVVLFLAALGAAIFYLAVYKFLSWRLQKVGEK